MERFEKALLIIVLTLVIILIASHESEIDTLEREQEILKAQYDSLRVEYYNASLRLNVYKLKYGSTLWGILD